VRLVVTALILIAFALGLALSGDLLPAVGLAAWVTWMLGSFALRQD
jgi:hypothetical protein